MRLENWLVIITIIYDISSHKPIQGGLQLTERRMRRCVLYQTIRGHLRGDVENEIRVSHPWTRLPAALFTLALALITRVARLEVIMKNGYEAINNGEMNNHEVTHNTLWFHSIQSSTSI